MRREIVIKLSAFLTLLAALASVGCVSQYAVRLTDVRRDFYDSGDPGSAREEIEKRLKRASSNERSVWTLNEASVDFALGDFESAKTNLRAVRDEFDVLEETRMRSLAEDALTFATDDSFAKYEGDDYEKVMIRATLAISELMTGGGDAKAYARQISAKQDEIVARGQIADPRDARKTINPKLKYPRAPLGPYIEGLLWEETFMDSSEAARLYEKVVAWRPQFKQGQSDLRRAREGVHSHPGAGRLYVFAYVGRGPRKVQGSAEATQFALLIADQIFSATNKYSVPPTLAPVPIPELVVEEPQVASIELSADGETQGCTETLADVNEMAIKQFEATRDQIIARAIVRRIVKKGAIYAAKEAAQVNGWVSLAMDAAGVAWEATEVADARCWGLLPAKIQTYGCELPTGERTLEFRPIDASGRLCGEPTRVQARIDANRNTYVLVVYPDGRPMGAPIVSTR